MSDPLMPLAEVVEDAESPADPETFGGAPPITNLPPIRNLADDQSVIAFIQDELFPLIEQTRLDRQGMEEEWAAIRRMEMQKHDAGQRYKGRSNAYLPIYNRVLATVTSALSKGLFPTDEYMDVVDRRETNQDNAKLVKSYLQWEFDSVGKVRQNIKPFLRQFCNYGNSVLKFWYNKNCTYQGRIKNMADVARLTRSDSEFRKIQNDGLAVSTRSIFNWFVYPMTASSLDDAVLVFEDIDITRMHIERMQREKKWVNCEVALAGSDSSGQHRNRMSEQLNDSADVQVSSSHDNGGALGNLRTIQEVWTFMPLPRSEYTGDEVPGTPVPVRVVLCGITPLEVTRNPNWHQRPPYVVGRQNVNPGLFYGSGFGRAVRHMQYLANDFMNQTNDVGIYTLNPIVKMNPGKMSGPPRPLAPGVTWLMTDMDAVEFDRPDAELVQYGLQMVNTVVGMAQDFGGAPPVLQGSGAGKGAKTATGAQILQRNAMQPLQDVVEDLELDVMCELLRFTWINAQQYRDEETMVQVAGKPLKVPKEALAIDADFRWMASSQAANQQARQQQATQLIQVVAPLVPLLQQQGLQINFEPLLKRIYSDGLGFKNYDQFITKIPMSPMGIPMDAQGIPVDPAMGGAPMPEGDRVRSTTEQADVAGGGGGEMVPGEGDDFQAVRADADDLAGSYGGDV